MAIALGIDTGGTYTDAVLLEYDNNGQSGRVLASAKALTTKHDLIVGIRGAVQAVLADVGAGATGADVQLVSLSTTLATNAIVEGNGAPICALLIGYEGRIARDVNLERELGTARYALIGGGHLTNGEEWQPLDEAAARAAIAQHGPAVAAFAISGYFGTRNPAHELAVRQMVREMTGLPATCGHELTHRLDALRRATTVALNARLIPLLCGLIDSVERLMAEEEIHAPLMVVKGDGSLMDSALAKERPVETILSGPAASVIGAQHLARSAQAVVVDMGGTTTDIAVLRGDAPRLSLEGAQVGTWRTMVEAIDIHTAGLGGDSYVRLDDHGELRVGPRRVVPLSLLATEYPAVRATLTEQLDALSRPRPTAEREAYGEFLVSQSRDWTTEARPPFEGELMARLAEGPCPLVEAHHIMRHPELYGPYLQRLERQGIVVRAAFTPSDAAHVLRRYDAWDRPAAELAASLLARRAATEAQALCQQVLREVSAHVAREIVHKLLHDDGADGHHDGSPSDGYLITRALCPQEEQALSCQLTLAPALVAIGAPVETYFPLVAHMLNAQLVIPTHADVANAIGAVVGSVIARVHVLVVPDDDGERYRLHLPDEVRPFATLAEALAYGEQRARQLALEGGQRAGAQDLRVRVARRDHTAPVANGWGQTIFVQTDLEVTAIGRPRLAVR